MTKAKDYILLILGTFLTAAGVALFIIPNNIITGGTPGIALIINEIFGISETIAIYTLSISLFLLGWIILGNDFAKKTIISSFMYPVFIDIMTNYINIGTITNDLVLAIICGSVLLGSGIGIVLKIGGSTGGMDIPPIIINKFFKRFSISFLVLIIDGITVISGIFTFGIEPILIGLITTYTISLIINRVLVGGNANYSVYIISDFYQEINKEILEKIDRGTTILNATGGFTNENKPVIMSVFHQTQYPKAMELIKTIDPHAFIIVHNVADVSGRGFTINDHHLGY